MKTMHCALLRFKQELCCEILSVKNCEKYWKYGLGATSKSKTIWYVKKKSERCSGSTILSQISTNWEKNLKSMHTTKVEQFLPWSWWSKTRSGADIRKDQFLPHTHFPRAKHFWKVALLATNLQLLKRIGNNFNTFNITINDFLFTNKCSNIAYKCVLFAENIQNFQLFGNMVNVSKILIFFFVEILLKVSQY